MRECLPSASLQAQMMLQRRFKNKKKSRRKSSIMMQSLSLQMITISISSWELPAIQITNIKRLSNNSNQSLLTTGVKLLSTIFRINLASRSNRPQPSNKPLSLQHWAPHLSICSSMTTWTLRRGKEFWRQSVPTRKEHICSSRSKKQRT